jgi:DNA polymerase-3 subunit delta'
MLGDFIGNARQVGWLERAIALGQASHAYLFTGPKQIGKRTLAYAFAQAIQCDDRAPGSGAACGVCVACRKAKHGNHPDILRISLPKDKQHYSIDQVREIIEDVALLPTEGRKRIIILPDMERMLTVALQSSLKVLEEPPPTAMILLTCASVDLLLPTIISRCQQVALTPVAPDELAAALVARGECDPAQAHQLATLSGGCPGRALDALEHPESLEERRQTLHDLAALSRAGRAERITAAGTLAPNVESAQRIIALWLPWWRDVTLAAYGAPEIIRYADARAAILAQARVCGPAAAATFVRALVLAAEQLEQNANPRLVFEVLLQSLPSA